MSVQLLNQFGRPFTSFGYSGASLYESTDESGTRLSRPNLNQDIATLLSREKHRALISDSRYIATTFPLVQGAVQQKSHYVCQAGFAPVYTGKNRDWGRTARAELLKAHRIIDARGGMFRWDKSWQIGCTAIDVDASFFVVFGETPDGYPQLQFLEAHRVGCRHGETVVTSGPYSGLRILNGIVYNSTGREVAYRVLGSDATQDRDISAVDMMHVAVPRWFSDGRPFPSIAYSILDWYDAKEARGFQRLKQKINSALTMIETTESGTPDGIATPYVPKTSTPTVATAQPQTLSLAGGLIRYVKAGSGSIKSHGDNTPGDGWLRFDERIIAGAFYGMDWRAEMLDLSKLSGAPTRGFQDQINTTIYARWMDLTPFVYRAEMWLLAKLIKRGDIAPDSSWLDWTYTPPAEFTVDGGRSNRADLDNIRAGTDTIPSIIGRFGRTSEDVLRETADYLRQRNEIAKEYGLDPSELGTLAQPGLNAQVTLPDPEPAKPKPAAPAS